jgi:hypothetical protein
VLVTDIATFLLMYVPFVFFYFVALYVLYPTAHGFEHIAVVDEFNTWWDALAAVLQVRRPSSHARKPTPFAPASRVSLAC